MNDLVDLFKQHEIINLSPKIREAIIKKKCCFYGTRVMAEYEIWEPLQCKSVFNTYLSLGRSNQKVEESGLAFL